MRTFSVYHSPESSSDREFFGVERHEPFTPTQLMSRHWTREGAEKKAADLRAEEAVLAQVQP